MEAVIGRHRTAISRRTLSRPVSLAVSDGLLNNGMSFFDYGCGRGEDLLRLSHLGYRVSGWDPVHHPDAARHDADVVNLGYVVNVIEDPQERTNTLRKAWHLTSTLLIVSARMAWESSPFKRPCGDGTLTKKGTFQKFFEQEELRTWIDDALDVRSVAAAPGVFYVFRDAARAQTYLAGRLRRTHPNIQRQVSEAAYATNRDLLHPLVNFVLTRGRAPELPELPEAPAIVEQFGSIRRALRVVESVLDEDAWRAAQTTARDDLILYLALAAFGRRPKFKDLPADIQQDVRSFFGRYREACRRADELLYSAGNQSAIDSACRASPVGKLTAEALYVHVDALSQLSSLLRVYEGCAQILTGKVNDANVVKLSRVHPRVSYLSYPSFDRDPHPTLQSSARADLRRLDVRVKDFRNWVDPPILHRKEAIVAHNYPQRAKFARLTHQEEQAGLLAEPSRIGTRDRWLALVATRGLEFRGHRLIRVK